MRAPTLLAALVLVAGATSQVLAAPPTAGGAELYRAQCAYCHGKAGEGTKRYASPLAGDRSVAQLAKLVQETMPESDPGSLSDAEAKSIAEWMHGEFYSQAARDAAKPPRVELARLTVEQYRHTVGDLLASFAWEPDLAAAKPGLKGQYFNGRGWDDKKRKLERTDPVVAFDFADKPPSGGDGRRRVLHPLGRQRRPARDRRVRVRRPQQPRRGALGQRRQDPDHRRARAVGRRTPTHRLGVSLSAGRPYPLKLEFSKAKRGVQDKVVRGKPEPAFVHLEWKRPGQPVAPCRSRRAS